MGLAPQQILEIEKVLRTGIRNKLARYSPETNGMPFHTRLLGADRMAVYSFIQSLNTTFGVSVFEPVALVLARHRFAVAQTHVSPGSHISELAQREIQAIMNALTTAESAPNKLQEIERIRQVSQGGGMHTVRLPLADLCVQDEHGGIMFFDLKTVKPNKGDFEKFKRTLLEWGAAALADNPSRVVRSVIAIPYNPYEPKPYARWTMRGMLDLEHELLVGPEFWDFLGGDGAYQDLLDIFERIGIELGPEIDKAFERYK